MSTLHVGTANLKIGTEIVFDPRYGYQTRETYVGPLTSLSTLNATLQLLGVRTLMTVQGNQNLLSAFYAVQDPSGTETPTDYYELETEYVQESVWKNDLVEALAGDLTTLAQWKREINSALNGRLLNPLGEEESKVNGPLPPSVFDGAANEKALYELILRDGDAYETTRQVLTRVRNISIAYSSPAVAQARPIIYTTAQLGAVFSIPTTIQGRLPADPAEVPSGTLWSWKQRRNTSRYEWNGRVAEVMSWTFAAWSTVTHQLFTG